MTSPSGSSQISHVGLPDAAPDTTVDPARHAQLRAVFEREFHYVWTTLRRLGVHARDREDLLQEVFVRVYARLADYDPSRPFRPWLFAFVFHCASDWRRLARHRVEVLGDTHPDSPAEASGFEERMAHAQDRELVARALEYVPIDRRAVLILYELDECSMKDIAKSLDIPLFTAYSRLRVARDEFTLAVRSLRARGAEHE